jgi:tetraacyldisaccharide 4'-kinase
VAGYQLEKLEQYFLSVIDGQRRTKGAIMWRFALKMLSHLFGTIVQIRLKLYELRLLRHHTLGCQVVSVGNLTVGGTGKTPIVEIFARSLQQSGRKVAILSRGYKKKKPPLGIRMRRKFKHLFSESRPPLVVSDGKRLLLGSALSGDEPYMLASNLNNVAVLVDKDRVKAGKYAIKELGCDTLILDDGFQHLRLQHWVDIVLVDSTNPFHNENVLPRGLLREPVKNIRRASFIFITKCREPQEELKARLRALNPKAEISECRHCPRYLENVYTGERQTLEFLRGKKVAAVSGIAAPQGFENELIKFGAEVIHHKRYADHHRYSQKEMIDRINKSIERGADMIVTTEKDAVRFPRIKRRDLDIYFMRVEIELLSGQEDFDACIKRICFKK